MLTLRNEELASVRTRPIVLGNDNAGVCIAGGDSDAPLACSASGTASIWTGVVSLGIIVAGDSCSLASMLAKYYVEQTRAGEDTGENTG